MRGIFHRIVTKYRFMRIRNKLILAFVPLLALPSIVMGYIYFETSSNLVYDNVSRNMLELIKKKNELIDGRLENIEASAMSVNVDKQLQSMLSSSMRTADESFLQLDRSVTRVLYTHFPPAGDIYSRHIVTDRYVYGINTVYFPLDTFYKSELYNRAMKVKGQLVWIPTYDFTEMFDQQEMQEVQLDYRHLISAVQIINPINIDDGSPVLHEGKQPPVLILNFKESDLYRLLQDPQFSSESIYMVIASDGQIVSHSNPERLGKREDSNWLNEAIQNGSGSKMVNIEGRDMLICYDTSKVTGWLSAVAIPVDALSGRLNDIRLVTLYVGAILAILSIGLAYLISNRITRPLKNLLTGIQRMGEGKFSNNVPVTSYDEFGHLIAKFNNMDLKIQKLIEENYETQLREQEAQIMALNLQLNPHFLYNTLNTIHWMALENGRNDISELIFNLCTILQYTMRHSKESASFQEEWNWLQSYVHVMKARFEGKFDFHAELDERLFEQSVPKLFLQPFIENSILHGFKHMEENGVILLSGKIVQEGIVFRVQDNGRGMDMRQMQAALAPDNGSIGIRNVDRRIKLLYGEPYGVRIKSSPGEGTEVVIRLPFQDSSD